MTIIAAMKKDGQVWMVSDQLTSWGSFVRSDSTRVGKVRALKHALIGTAGRVIYNNALGLAARKDSKFYNMRFDNEEDVLEFYVAFFKFMQDQFKLGNSDANEVQRLSWSQFLIVTPSKMFTVSAYRDVMEYDNYAAIGSGEELMYGAMHALNGFLQDPKEILERAYETTIHFVSNCGGPLKICNVAEALKAEAKEHTVQVRKKAKATAKATAAKAATKSAAAKAAKKAAPKTAAKATVKATAKTAKATKAKAPTKAKATTKAKTTGRKSPKKK